MISYPSLHTARAPSFAVLCIFNRVWRQGGGCVDLDFYIDAVSKSLSGNQGLSLGPEAITPASSASYLPRLLKVPCAYDLQGLLYQIADSVDLIPDISSCHSNAWQINSSANCHLLAMQGLSKIFKQEKNQKQSSGRSECCKLSKRSQASDSLSTFHSPTKHRS